MRDAGKAGFKNPRMYRDRHFIELSQSFRFLHAFHLAPFELVSECPLQKKCTSGNLENVHLGRSSI